MINDIAHRIKTQKWIVARLLTDHQPSQFTQQTSEPTTISYRSITDPGLVQD